MRADERQEACSGCPLQASSTKEPEAWDSESDKEVATPTKLPIVRGDQFATPTTHMTRCNTGSGLRRVCVLHLLIVNDAHNGVKRERRAECSSSATSKTILSIHDINGFVTKFKVEANTERCIHLNDDDKLQTILATKVFSSSHLVRFNQPPCIVVEPYFFGPGSRTQWSTIRMLLTNHLEPFLKPSLTLRCPIANI